MEYVENPKTHITESLKLLDIQKRTYVGGVKGGRLEDHFMSIEHGLRFLVKVLNVSENNDLKLRIQYLVGVVKQKLYSLPNNQEDENLIVKLDRAYGELREEMQKVVIEPGTNDYVTLFSKNSEERYYFISMGYFLLQSISILVTSSCKADRIAPLRKELEELRKKMTSLKPLFNYVEYSNAQIKEDNDKVMAALLTTFFDRATCLIYLSFVGKLNGQMLVSLRKNFSLLMEETEINEMSRGLEIIAEDDLEPDISLSTWEDDIDMSLSLLNRQEDYYIGTINEAVLKDHIMSLKHGIEFLKWLPKIYNDRNLELRILLLVGKVKQKLEWITYKLGDESLNMDVNGAYVDLREEMKDLIIVPVTDLYDTLFQKGFIVETYLRSNNDFLVEKITTLVTSNCKADQIASLKKELQGLRKMLTFLKPLCVFVDHSLLWLGGRGNVLATLLTVHQKAAFPIYLSYVGKMDTETVLSVKSNISTAIMETDVCEMYNMILKDVLFRRDYIEEELYLLENVILLLRCNIGSLNDANFKLYEVFVDIHCFLLGLIPNVLLRKRHLLQQSFQAVLGHSIPIICSCYVHTEVDISSELNCVLDMIKHIKSEALEIKLYYFPRVDDLGFLEFFSGYLEDLVKNQEISMKREIDALRFEVHSLLSLVKVTHQEKLNEAPWTDIINMAYQAEYIIDFYLASSTRDLGLISSLSKIIERLKNMRADVQSLCCKSLPDEDVTMNSKPQVLGTTTQVSDNDAILCFQEEARTITMNLLEGEKKLDIISIVGMAGVGKTTLAMTIYKTPSTAYHFDILAWCTVSQSYRNRALLLSILDQVTASDKSHRSMSDDEALADYLCRKLKKRRYLIVLDDIWDTTLWNYLKRYLPDDKEGSRILMTTRNKDVAHQIGSKVNELLGLSDDMSWELFQKKMFENESLSENLLKISKGMVEHCKGLPLSIVIIAGILSDIERTEKKWNQIAESVSSMVLSDSQGKCKAILELSYNHLPNHLRSCFLYMGSFPEDIEIDVDLLISLWIAEGLVSDTKSDSIEEVAKKYIEDFILKSLVIPTKERSRGVKTFRLHDLLHEFCLDKAKEKHFFTMLDQRNDSRPLQDPRRLLISEPLIKGLPSFCHSVRSMICFHKLDSSEIEKRVESRDLVLLRVLVVGEVSSKLLPKISSLFHLRYLALKFDNWGISVLPSSVSKLQNLQTLILVCSDKVIKVPDSIWDMVKLRSVDIIPEASFEVHSKRLEHSSFMLENLRSLLNARVTWSDSKWLRKLAWLQRLGCALVEDNGPEEADLADSLSRMLRFNGQPTDDVVKDNQFRMLSFNDQLTSLKVENTTAREQRFISTCQLPNSLRTLTLSKFFLTSDDISKIGALCHLESLRIYACKLPSGQDWNVNDEGFRGLKVLKLRGLQISKWIASQNSFPVLEKLWVERCHPLDEIPLDFGYLLKLRLIFVSQCARSVDDSAREIEKLQHEDQNTEMRVHIYPRK